MKIQLINQKTDPVGPEVAKTVRLKTEKVVWGVENVMMTQELANGPAETTRKQWVDAGAVVMVASLHVNIYTHTYIYIYYTSVYTFLKLF